MGNERQVNEVHCLQSVHDYPLDHVNWTGKLHSRSGRKCPLEYIDPALAIPAGAKARPQSSAGFSEGGVSAVHI